MDAEEAGLDGSVGGDAFERLGQSLALVIGGHLPEALGHAGGVLREGVRGARMAPGIRVENSVRRGMRGAR
jgi:hypothetical protein